MRLVRDVALDNITVVDVTNLLEAHYQRLSNEDLTKELHCQQSKEKAEESFF